MSKIYRIYKCTNMNNGKTYIGFTHKVLEKRAIEPMLGKKHSDETKEKMSLAKLGKLKNDSYKKTCSERNLKRYSDPDKRKILSDAIKLSWQKRKLQQIGVQN